MENQIGPSDDAQLRPGHLQSQVYHGNRPSLQGRALLDLADAL